MNKKISFKIAMAIVIIFSIWFNWFRPVKHKIEIDIHEDNIFDDSIIGSIPMEYFSKTHVCELWDGEPTQLSGLFTYDFDTDQWIWCQ